MRPEAERGIVFMKKWKKVLAAGLLTVLFSCAVCAQAISAGNGRDMLHTDAHGLAVGTAAGGKGPPSKSSGGQEIWTEVHRSRKNCSSEGGCRK